MKRGRPPSSDTTPVSGKRLRGSGSGPDTPRGKEAASPGKGQGEQPESEPTSPAKKGTAAKLPALTEDQIKARFEGMTTRHKRTPSKKLLDSADTEDTKSAPNTPKPSAGKPSAGKPNTPKPSPGKPNTPKPGASKPNTPKTGAQKPSTVKPSAGRGAKTPSETPKQPDSAVKRGRGRPPKQQSDTPPATPAKLTTTATTVAKQRQSPRAQPVTTPAVNKPKVGPAAQGVKPAGGAASPAAQKGVTTVKKVQPVSAAPGPVSRSPVAQASRSPVAQVSRSPVGKVVSGASPVQSAPILETLSQAVTVPAAQLIEQVPEPPQPIRGEQHKPRDNPRDTDEQTKTFIEKIKSRLGPVKQGVSTGNPQKQGVTPGNSHRQGVVSGNSIKQGVSPENSSRRIPQVISKEILVKQGVPPPGIPQEVPSVTAVAGDIPEVASQMSGDAVALDDDATLVPSTGGILTAPPIHDTSAPPEGVITAPPGDEQEEPEVGQDEQTEAPGEEGKGQKAKDASQAPVTVNIVLKDQSCLPYMADVGMHILYYCKHCTFYSQQLLSVIEHIKTCDKVNSVESNAVEGKEEEVAEYLESVALSEIQEEKGAAQDTTNTAGAPAPSGGEEREDVLMSELNPEELSAETEEQEEEFAQNQDDDDDDWKPYPTKKLPRVLMEETEEDRIQKLCDICQKPVFTFSVRRHMEGHARREAEVAAKEKAKAIALGLDMIPEMKNEAQMDSELSVDASTIKGTLEVIETSGAAAIAVPAQPEIELTGSTGQIEAAEPSQREVTITIRETPDGEITGTPDAETDADTAIETPLENGESTTTNGAGGDYIPQTIPKGLALKKTLFPCKLHELYFVSQEALTEHFMSEHWVGYVEPSSVLPHIKRGRGRPRGSATRGRGGSNVKVPGRPGITPDEEAAAVAMSVMRHSKLGWSRQKANPGRGGPVKCPVCYKKFASSFRLEMHHARAHTADKMKPVPCQICGKLFRNQVQRRNHFRIVHEGKKRIQSQMSAMKRERKLFICDLCGYSTPDNSRLKNHIMSVHQGIMPYACDQCDYKCNEKSDIVRHKHKHLGIKRYSCDYCTYRADQRWLLVNHTAKQHGVQLPKNPRNTKGTYFSIRNKKRRDTSLQQINPLQWLLQNSPDIQIQEPSVKGEPDAAMTEAAHAVLELGDVGSDGQAAEQVTVYIEEVLEEGATGAETVETYTEGQEISVEELQQVVHDSKPGEVMYVREDGTVIEPEEAALLLMSVNTPGSNIQIEEVTQLPEEAQEELILP